MVFSDDLSRKMDEFRTKSELSLEAKVCKRLLAHAGNLQIEMPTDEGLTLDWLRRQAACPLHLKVERIPWVFEMDWGDLFTRFNATKLVAAYDEWYVECSQEEGKVLCGLITPWARRGFLVMHNYYHTPRANYTQILRPTAKLGMLIFEELDAMAEALNWG